jgi:CubicO group peptidase (beta-lactamase class C family)
VGLASFAEGPDDYVSAPGEHADGYGLPEKPGTHWAYNDYAIALYNVTLFERVFDEGSPNAVARHSARLGALQFEDGSIFGPDRDGFGLRTSARDFARIGWFWLNRGNWDGTEVLDEGYFDLFQGQVARGLPRTAGGEVNDYLNVGTQGGGADQTQLGPGVPGRDGTPLSNISKMRSKSLRTNRSCWM